MDVYSVNTEKYNKKIITQTLKNYILEWLSDSGYGSTFDLKETVDYCGQHKVNMLIYDIESLMEEDENYKSVYEKIIEFRNLRDLLNYLSPRSYDTAESTLLDIIRDYNKITIIEHKKNDKFKFYLTEELNEYIAESEKIANLSIYFRSYIKILLDIKKEAFNFEQLYKFLLEEEISYDLAKNYNDFLYFRREKSYSVPEILKLLEDEEVLTPKMIFVNQIKKDYNRFYKIIDNYYGLNDWDLETEFQVYLKLFDKFLQNNKDKYKYLGQKVLEFIPKVDDEKYKTRRLEKNIKRILERG